MGKCFIWLFLAHIMSGFVGAAMEQAHTQKPLRYMLQASPNSLDPLDAGDSYNVFAVTAIYDGLFQFIPYGMKVMPNLASSFPEVSKNGLIYKISLRKDAYFQEDACFNSLKKRAVVAQDFVFSIKRQFHPKNNSAVKWMWDQTLVQGLDEWVKLGGDYNKEISGLKAIDDSTVQITLTHPFPQLLFTLASPLGAVVPKEAVDFYGSKLATHPVSTGPFQVISFNEKKLVLKKNPDFRKEIFSLKDSGYDPLKHKGYNLELLDGKQVPLSSEIHVEFITSPQISLSSIMKDNELDYARLSYDIGSNIISTGEDVKLLKPYADKLHFALVKTLSYVYYEFNLASEDIGYNKNFDRNLKNRSLRCAVRKAFNWKKRIDTRFLGIGKPFVGIIPEGVEGHEFQMDHDSISYFSEKDKKIYIDAAQKILADAGWTKSNLPVLFFSGTASSRIRQDYEQFKMMLTEIGYPKEKIQLKTFATFSSYWQEARMGHLQFYGDVSWHLDYPDPVNVLQIYYSKNKAPGSNLANFDNKAYDDLYDKIKITPPSLERQNLIKQAQKIVIDECVTISGFTPTTLHVWRKGSTGVVLYPGSITVGTNLKFMGRFEDLVKP